MTISNAWAIYAGILTGALALYYLFVGWKFYRLEISSLFASAKTNRRLSVSTAVAGAKPPGGAVPNVDKTAAGQAKPLAKPPLAEHQDLYNHLTSEIEEACEKNYDKQDLIQMLQMILTEYPSLIGTSFQDAVNRHIDAECARFGAVLLNPADKAALWEMQ